MRCALKSLFFSALIFSLPAAANAAFSLESPDNSPGVDPFLKAVEQSIPPFLAKTIDAPVTVRFEKLDEHDDIEVFCPKDEAGSKPTGLHRYGKLRLSIFGNPKNPLTVTLHSGFLKILASGPEAAEKLPCSHGDLYRYAEAALIHELGHIFDYSEKLLTETDKEYLRHCERQKQEGSTFRDIRCDALMNMKGKVSERLRYKNLFGFVSGNEKNKNLLLLQSPDPYEFSSPREHFAVNLEYFLLDKNYACKRPAHYQYYSEVFQHKPFGDSPCKSHAMVLSSTGLSAVSLDPARAYQVHYIFAGRGEPLMSRWGHAMLRVVMCAPERKEVGPDCLKDVPYHVIISFRANVEGTSISYWDGLIGKYPSQLLIVSVGEILEEYNRMQLREISSLPLALSDSQKSLLIKRALEQYWGYAGKYYFLSNNCASETDQLLKGVLDEYHRYQELSSMSPLGIYDDMEDAGLVDKKILDDKNAARASGHFFPSQRAALEKSVAVASKSKTMQDIDGIDSYANTTSADDRLRAFRELAPTLETKSAFYLLEKHIYRLAAGDLQSKALKLILKSESDSTDASSPAKLQALLDRITKARRALLPWNMVASRASYGVPAPDELITAEKLQGILVSLKADFAVLTEEISKLLPEQHEEVNKIRENLRTFTPTRN